ncbi:MAG: LamG domain-containing protein [Bacteroidales bacterium]|jgi:hypothetical protein|nr:LamG domain-containing protein [Bacteroidales bacterium]
MKKYLSILFAAATAAALAISCSEKEDDNGGKIDADDPASVKTENLIAYFPLESEAKTIESGKGITYSAKAGAASFTKGVRGNCYQNSSNDANTLSYLDFALAADNQLKSMTSFTISAWIKVGFEFDTAPAIISLNGGDPGMGSICLFLDGAHDANGLGLKYYLFNTSTNWKGQDIQVTNEAFTPNRWLHIVYSYDESDSKIKFYADGEFIGDSVRYADGDPDGPEGPVEQPLLGKLSLGQDSSHLYFGAWWNNLDGSGDEWRRSYPGLLDEVRIWNVALTDAEVESLYEKEVIKADGLTM